MTEQFTLKPVYGEQFIGRKEMLEGMLREIRNPKSNTGFCLHGRRRVGKTSLLRELEHELGEDRIVVAYLSLYELAGLSLKTFIEQLSAAVLEAFRQKGAIPLEYAVRVLIESPSEVISSALSKIRVGAELSEELRFFLEFRKGKHGNHTEAAKRAFGLGEKLAQSTGMKFVLILDEFPEILKLENGMQLVKMLRTAHEGHRSTVVIISGSERKTLEAVALDSASPFYRQLVPKSVPPFSFGETQEFLRKYGMALQEGGARRMHELTGGLPFYLQFIGRSVSITGDIEGAVKEFIKQEGNLFFTEEFEKLSAKEGVVVRAMANGASSPTEISRASGEPVTSVSSYLVSLQDKGVAVKAGKAAYALSDALFSLWLKERHSHA